MVRNIFNIFVVFIVIIVNQPFCSSGEIIEDVKGENIFEFGIHPSLRLMEFHLYGNDSNIIERIEIRWKESQKNIQVIEPQMGEPPYRGSEYFKAADFNFDGYKDIRLLSWWGATGNKGYEIWTYDPKKRIFVHNKELSGLGNPHPDYEKKEIHTFGKCGHAGKIYGKGVWKYIDGKLTLTRTESQDWIKEKGYYLKTVKKLRDGKLVIVNERIIPLQ
jgi:hypothetical protein